MKNELMQKMQKKQKELKQEKIPKIKSKKAKTKKSNTKKKFSLKSFFKWFFSILLLFFVLGFSCVGIIMYHYSKQATTVSLNLSKQPIENSFTILDANNEPLQEHKKVSQFLPIYTDKSQKNVSDFYLNTLISIEDSTFYTRKTKGYEIKDVAKAVILSLESKLHLIPAHQVRGGSSIDQQLIKTLVFGGSNAEMTMSRKIIEVLDSHSLATRYSRNEILQAYLDSIRLTSETIGVRAAYSDLFGDSDMTKLNASSSESIARTAFMAGLGQAPTQYTTNFETAPKGYLSGKQRTIIVLGVMKEKDLISEKQYNDTVKYVKSKDFKLITFKQNGVDPKYQSYVSYVNQELSKLSLPTNSSIEIKTYTTKAQLDKLSEISHGKYNLQPEIPNSQFPSEKDNAAIAVVDTKTGHVIGLSTNSSDPTVPFTSIHSSGSTVKPFLDYAPALEYGMITQNSTLNGNGANSLSGVAYSGTQLGLDTSAPQNYGGQNYGMVNASFALGLSLNSAALQVFKMTTNDQKLSILQPLGVAKTFNDHLDENGNADESLSINYTISMLEEASAYSAFGNDGIRVTPTAISNIKIDGKEVQIKKPDSIRAMSSSTARSINNMLQFVTKPNGSEPKAASEYIGQPSGNYSVKSGLSNYPQTEMAQYSPDALMSYTSQDISVSVWFGAPNMSTNYEWGIPNGTGNLPENNTRVYLLNSTVKAMMNGKTSSPFTYSGERMQKVTQSSITIPTLNSFLNQSDINQIKSYNPKTKTIKDEDKKFYDEHVNDSLITSDQIAK